MTWFLAILLVLAIGAVAVVASGRGRAMQPTFDDRPDVRVQADGPLTAQDLRGVRFTTAFRGYRMAEVDALLDRLAAELEPPVTAPRDRDEAPAGPPPAGGVPTGPPPTDPPPTGPPPTDPPTEPPPDATMADATMPDATMPRGAVPDRAVPDRPGEEG